ncbi:MAG TPA: hypothetical protein DCR14_10445 [Acidimicrobiaceae bacterium]|nr:hypothetical protein [Acidimicrobiaceae bacterium]
MIARRFALPVVAMALLAAACSDDGSSGSSGTSTPTATDAPATDAPTTTEAPTTTAAPTTTLDPAAVATTYADYGPHPVGVTTLQLAKGPKVEVWYPAAEGSEGTDSYDVRDFVPEAIKAVLTADIPAGYSYPGSRDAAVAEGSFPVVLFSHGFTGIRLQSTFLTAHLASWGMIVVSPDHPSRDLTNVLGGTASGDRADAVDDLLQSLELISAAGTDPASPFNGRVDAERVIAVGHSAGGGTVLGAAADDRIDGYVSLASGAFLGGGDTSGSTTTTAPPLPDKPSFFMAGSVDFVVPAETATRPAFEAAPSPSLLWIIEGVGHNGFDDFCTFGNGTGIIGIAEASGLGPLLEAQPQLRTLGEDGCIEPAVPVDTTFPIITHGVTAWVLAQFGVDEAAVGIGPDFADAFAVPVEIEEK